MRKRVLSVIGFTLILSNVSFSQEFSKPNFALKSHETLEITRVVLNDKSTIIHLIVENKRSEGGSFCADKKIYILYPDGSRLNILKANNIPVCPDAY